MSVEVVVGIAPVVTAVAVGVVPSVGGLVAPTPKCAEELQVSRLLCKQQPKPPTSLKKTCTEPESRSSLAVAGQIIFQTNIRYILMDFFVLDVSCFFSVCVFRPVPESLRPSAVASP